MAWQILNCQTPGTSVVLTSKTSKDLNNFVSIGNSSLINGLENAAICLFELKCFHAAAFQLFLYGDFNASKNDVGTGGFDAEDTNSV